MTTEQQQAALRIRNAACFFVQGWTYAADDSRDGGGRAKQEARAEHRDGRERLWEEMDLCRGEGRHGDLPLRGPNGQSVGRDERSESQQPVLPDAKCWGSRAHPNVQIMSRTDSKARLYVRPSLRVIARAISSACS